MKRVLLDANVYGELAIDPALARIKERMLGGADLVFYGSEVIRKELRDTPKSQRFANRNLRILLLSIYDEITKERALGVSAEISVLADNFYRAYKQFGGLKPKHEIMADFLIIASAVLHGLDVVVSNDEKTMFTENAVKAYRLICTVKEKRVPRMIAYDDFRRWFV